MSLNQTVGNIESRLMVWPRLPAAQQRCYWSESVQVNRQRSFGHLAITSAAIATSCFSQFKKKSPLSTVKQTVLLRLLFCLSLLNFADAINILAGKLRHYLFCCYDCIQLVCKSKLEWGRPVLMGVRWPTLAHSIHSYLMFLSG